MIPRTVTHDVSLSRLGGLLASAALLLASGCVGSEPEPLAPTTAAEALCVDDDADGYGLACEAGPDCDDDDAGIHTQCECREPVTEGCPCELDGAYEACGEMTIQVGKQTVCGMGYATCEQGVWGPCILNPAAELANAG